VIDRRKPVSRSLFFSSILVPGFAYLWRRQVAAFAWVFVTVLVTYGVYAILLDSVSSLARSHAAWHVLAVLGLAIHLTAAVHGARGQTNQPVKRGKR
jgi:predicted membrane channel-forming protein YqfA (hemolysin III family)